MPCSLAESWRCPNDPAALFFCTEEGGSRFLQNVGTYPSRYNASHPRRQ